MKVPLYKLFLVQAAYAVPLALFSWEGYWGVVGALVLGTGLSGLILVGRRGDFLAIFKVTLGGSVGAALGALVGGDPSPFSRHFSVTGAILGGAIGALLGGLIFSLLPLTLRHPRRHVIVRRSRFFGGQGETGGGSPIAESSSSTTANAPGNPTETRGPAEAASGPSESTRP